MLKWLRELITRHEAADTPPLPLYNWCQCERPIYLTFIEQVGEWLCDCGRYICQHEDCAGDSR